MPRQPAFAGSDRAYRGALLKALTASRAHMLSMRAARRIVPAGALERIVAGLERDGLVHRSHGRLLLGGRPDPAATIGA